MKVFYSDRYTIPLPPGHRFPMQKYRQVRESLIRQNILGVDEIAPSPLASREVVLAAHESHYYDAIESGYIDPKVMRRIGFPWSYELYLRSLATVGGALAAATEALETGFSGNLAGGTHHAHAGTGEGYCVFNDQAAVALYLLEEKKSR